MSLRDFIRGHQEEIIREFAAFAKTLMPPEAEMTEAELRDHAEEMLTAVVQDMGMAQTQAEQHRKSQGRGSLRTMEASGRLHADDRILHGYTFQSVLAEFRALRASVLRLYETSGASDLREVRRFNEAIDEALTESMHQFARERDLIREELDAKSQKNTSLIAEVGDRRAAEEKIKALYRQLVSMQDEERRRISRDIHDHLGQQVTALRLTLDRLDAPDDGDIGRRNRLGRARQLAEEIDRSLDFLAWELRPAALEQFGLATALERLLAGWSRCFGITAEFIGAGAETLRLPLDVATNLYRLGQEALHNVARHAGARHVAVSLQARGHEVVLIVEDDGHGFNPADVSHHVEGHGIGLASMRERAALCGGTLDIDAAPGRGTSISVRIPLAAESAPQDA